MVYSSLFFQDITHRLFPEILYFLDVRNQLSQSATAFGNKQPAIICLAADFDTGDG